MLEEPGVTIAVLTYRRPADLAAALRSLIVHRNGSNIRAKILVVDNDTIPSAEHIAAEFASEAVIYVHEPTPGIAAARNRALDVTTDSRLLIFIDDDERPEAGWLNALVGMWLTNRPTAIAGPVISNFPTQPDPWILEGGFFDRPRRSTGSVIEAAATNNLLLDARRIREFGLRFDDRFGLSGGSDTLFTRQIHRHGGVMLWCDEAVVSDFVRAERLNRRWVLRRAVRLGNSGSRAALAVTPSFGRRSAERLRLTFGGLARAGAGAFTLLAGYLLRSVRHQARGARRLARGLGILSGAWGYVVFDYQRKLNSGESQAQVGRHANE